MLINWFTVVAQIINFLALVLILKHFLFGRIIRAIDAREEKIASRLEDAERNKNETAKESESYRKKNKEFNDKREEMFSQAKEEVERWQKELIKQAREEVDQIQARWKETIQREKNSFLQDLRQHVSKQTYSIVRYALRDLANANLEQSVIEVFIQRIKGLDKNEWKAITESIEKSKRDMVICSAFEISNETRRRLIEVLHERIGDSFDMHFETSSDLICGIELKVNSYKIGWNLESYLETLEGRISQVFEEIRDETRGKEMDEKPRKEEVEGISSVESSEERDEKG